MQFDAEGASAQDLMIAASALAEASGHSEADIRAMLPDVIEALGRISLVVAEAANRHPEHMALFAWLLSYQVEANYEDKRLALEMLL